MTLKIITQINHIQISHQLKWKKIYKLKENIKDLLTLMKQIFIKILLVSPPLKKREKTHCHQSFLLRQNMKTAKNFVIKQDGMIFLFISIYFRKQFMTHELFSIKQIKN